MKISTSLPAFLATFFCIFYVQIFAQNGVFTECGTTENYQYLNKNGQNLAEFSPKSPISPISPNGLSKQCGQQKLIPVVVHVLHLGEQVGTASNISDLQIQNAIAALNDSWHNVNGLGVPIDITFQLARRTPNNTATSGIVRVDASSIPGYAANGVSFNGSAGPMDILLKNLSKWPVADYYNIWVVQAINGFPAGYAYYPNGGPYDGTIVRASSMGGGVLSHECGHAWNLAHTFDGDGNNAICPPDANCLLDGDGVCDTPPHKKGDCGTTNPCTPLGVWDNSRFNVMSYCSGNRFTSGQRDRVYQTMAGGIRGALLRSKGLIPADQPNELAFEDFVYPTLLVCNPSINPIIRVKNYGTTVAASFKYDLTIDGIFMGNFTQNLVNIPVDQTIDLELAPINLTDGKHFLEIKLTDINGMGNDIFQNDNQLCTILDRKDKIFDLCEDFETNALKNWMTFADTLGVRVSSMISNCEAEQSVALEINGSTNPDQTFTVGPVDLSGLSNPQLSFDLARRAPYFCQHYAEMTIEASSDCGKTTTLIYKKNDAPPYTCSGLPISNSAEELNTTIGAPLPSSIFSPSACTDWRKEILDLSAFTNSTVSFIFKINYFGGGAVANNLFIDNICLNKCVAPVKPFSVALTTPDTVHICVEGNATFSMDASPSTDNNVSYIWSKSGTFGNNYVFQTTGKTINLTEYSVVNVYLRGIAMKEGCADTVHAVLILHKDLIVSPYTSTINSCFGDSVILINYSNLNNFPIINYQWQSSASPNNGYTNVANTNYNPYYTTDIPIGQNYYRCVASPPYNGCLNAVSGYTRILVDEPIIITNNPMDITECKGGDLTVSVAYTGGTGYGAGAIGHKWVSEDFNTLYNGIQNIKRPNSFIVGIFTYRAIVSSVNGSCHDTSTVANITILPDPYFVLQPKSFSGCFGNTGALSASLGGGIPPFSYQWQTTADLAGNNWTNMAGGTDSTLFINADPGVNYYHLVASSAGSGCDMQISVPVSAAIDNPAVILEQPKSINQCIGSTQTISINATNGSFLYYQWQSSTTINGVFSNIPEFNASFTPPTFAVGSVFYRVILRSQNSLCRDTSEVAESRVNSFISITDDPDNFVGCVGNTVTLSAAAMGGVAPLNYQWRTSSNIGGPFINVPNATNITFTPPNLAGTFYYQIVVNSPVNASCSTANSNVAAVSFDGLFSIISEPISITECVGGNKSLSITTAGTGNINYQWQMSNSANGVFNNIINNQNTFTPVSNLVGTIYYRVIIFSPNGTCTDTSAVVSVNIVDNVSFSTQPASYSGCLGNPINLTTATLGGIAPLTYQWQTATSILGPFSTVNTATSNTFSPPNVAGNSFYQLLVNSAPGSGCATVFSSVAAVLLDSPVTITQHPTPVSECVGGTISMSATASGGGFPSFQWQKSATANGFFANISGATNPVFTPPAVAVSNNFFRIIAASQNGFCKDTSDAAFVQIVANTILTNQPDSYSGCLGNLVNLNASISGEIPQISFQWQSANAILGTFINIAGATNLSFSPPNSAGIKYFKLIITSHPNTACPIVTSQTATVILDGVVNIDSQPTPISECVGGNLPLNIAASGSGILSYQWQSANTVNGVFINILGQNLANFTPPNTNASTLFYRALVSSPNGFCKDTTAVVMAQVAEDLAFSTQPQDLEACVGGNFSLISQISGGIFPQFQWQSSPTLAGGWANIAGATATVFSPNLTAGGTVFYQIIATSNGAGCENTTSIPAEIFLHPAVQILAQPAPIFECVGGNQALIAIATGGLNLLFQWQTQLQNGDWQNIFGANLASFTPSAAQNFSSKKYRLVVSDQNLACGADTSAIANVQIETNFSIKKQVEICNFMSGNQPNLLNFNTLIISGDPNPNWISLDLPAPTGAWTAKDFTGFTPNTELHFVATTTNATPPCQNVMDTILVKILDCCPSVCTNPPGASFCNSGGAPLDLSTLECAGNAAGTWVLAAGPNVSQAQNLVNGQFDALNLAAGFYTISFNLSGNIPSVCPQNSTELIQIIETPNAGAAPNAVIFCEKEFANFKLLTLLDGADLGGVWIEISQNPTPTGAFDAAEGRLQIADLLPDTYRFKYEIAGVGACPGDAEILEIIIGKRPIAVAGLDGQLDCNQPKKVIGTAQNAQNNANIAYFWTEISHNGFVPTNLFPQITVVEPGIYVLAAIDSTTGCAAKDTVQITAASSFIKEVILAQIDPTCFDFADGKIEVLEVEGGTPPIVYSINHAPNSANNTFRNLKSGSYNLQVIDKNGCSTERNLVLPEPEELIVEITPDATILCGDSILLDAKFLGDTNGLVWYWKFNNTTLPNRLVPQFWAKPAQNAVFQIVAKNAGGCETIGLTRIKVDENLPYYAPTAFMPNSAENGIFRLFFHENVLKINRFSIFDRFGNLFFEQKDKSPTDGDFGWDGQFRGQKAAVGVYVFAVEILNCDQSVRVLKGSVVLVR